MHDTAELTVNQYLLLAADTLPQPFHESDLVEAAWKAAPRLLGMTRKHDKYPSDNKVRAALSGDRGLVKRGWLERHDRLMYSLTRHGKAEAARLSNGHADRRPLGKIEPSRELEAELDRLLVSKAVLRLRAGVGDTLNRVDAFAFWGTQGPDGVDATLAAARECLVGGCVRLRSGREVGEAELAEVGRTNNWLALKFRRELEKRARERAVA